VPCTLLGNKIEYRATRSSVEAFHGGQRVASHLRSYGPRGIATTCREHRPKSHREQAKFGMAACMEDVFCIPARGIDKSTVRTLGGCGWVRAKQNVIVTGQTGTGKSYIGAALAHAACRASFRALRTRVPRLLQELAVASADGSYVSTLNSHASLRSDRQRSRRSAPVRNCPSGPDRCPSQAGPAVQVGRNTHA
jgi:IstB-like ATP binding protein/Mu transposase, C-terminal domain